MGCEDPEFLGARNRMKQVQGFLKRLFLRANCGPSSSLIQSGRWFRPDVELSSRVTKTGEQTGGKVGGGQRGSMGEAPAQGSFSLTSGLTWGSYHWKLHLPYPLTKCTFRGLRNEEVKNGLSVAPVQGGFWMQTGVRGTSMTLRSRGHISAAPVPPDKHRHSCAGFSSATSYFFGDFGCVLQSSVTRGYFLRTPISPLTHLLSLANPLLLLLAHPAVEVGLVHEDGTTFVQVLLGGLMR